MLFNPVQPHIALIEPPYSPHIALMSPTYHPHTCPHTTLAWPSYRLRTTLICGWTGLNSIFLLETWFWEKPTFRSKTRFDPHLTISSRLASFLVHFEQLFFWVHFPIKTWTGLTKTHTSCCGTTFCKVLMTPSKSSCSHWPRSTHSSKLVVWK